MPSHRLFLIGVLALTVSRALSAQQPVEADADVRPNILLAIADDWGWPHAGAYGDQVVQTPTFDRLAREGVLFNHAYVSSPSCTPSRGAILTGQFHWRLEAGANLWSIFPDKFATYPEILESRGYQSGVAGKGWGPGRTETPNRDLAGHRFRTFEAFLEEGRDEGKPFVFWLGSSDPHRPYDKGRGVESGMNLEKVHLFGHFPDAKEVRSDIADYYWEVQRFDALVANAVKQLDARGLLENTIIVMTGDHGMPFPRCKANLYDSGTRVPLAIRFGAHIQAGRSVDDFVSLTDLAPTFLELAGAEVPGAMTGNGLLPILTSRESGTIDSSRSFVLAGKERHVPMQEAPDLGGYPCRAIRTHDFLYIRNFTPERWPAGTPFWEKATIRGVWLGDCDNGATKTYIVEHRHDDEAHQRYYELCFGKRPAEELYDLRSDPQQLKNVADVAEYADQKSQLSARLARALRETADPRALGEQGNGFEKHTYLGRGPRHPDSDRSDG